MGVKLTAELPSEREIRVTRSFAAPRALVFDTFTKAEHLKKWNYGPDEWPIVECEIDLKVGGAYRYVWRHKERGDMGLSGVFREINAPERIVYTELFDEDWTGGETIVTSLFETHGDQTIVTTTVLYSSKATRDKALATPMLDGWGQGYDRLDEKLSSAA